MVAKLRFGPGESAKMRVTADSKMLPLAPMRTFKEHFTLVGHRSSTLGQFQRARNHHRRTTSFSPELA